MKEKKESENQTTISLDRVQILIEALEYFTELKPGLLNARYVSEYAQIALTSFENPEEKP